MKHQWSGLIRGRITGSGEPAAEVVDGTGQALTQRDRRGPPQLIPGQRDLWIAAAGVIVRKR